MAEQNPAPATPEVAAPTITLEKVTEILRESGVPMMASEIRAKSKIAGLTKKAVNKVLYANEALFTKDASTNTWTIKS